MAKAFFARIALLLSFSLFACTFQETSEVNGRAKKTVGVVYETDPGENAIDLIEQALKEEGVNVVRIPHTVNNPDNDRIIGGIDGVVFPGGRDIDPATYGESNRFSEDTNGNWDEFERYVFNVVVEKNRRPILGICRGMQLINVLRGGKLIQDLPSERKSNVVHMNPDRSLAFHPIRNWDPLTTIGRSFGGAGSFTVNSLHHQAVDARYLGRNLKVTAVAPDDTVEAIESTAGPFVLGVQFHPEAYLIAPHHKGVKAVFSSFVSALK